MMTAIAKTDALILWGNHFDEAMAVIFASILRQNRIGVQLIGIHGRIVSGRNGIKLMADMTLSEVHPLIYKASAIIVPCHSPCSSVVANDPRILKLFVTAHEHGARFVTGHLSQSDAEIYPLPIHRIVTVSDPSDYTAAAVALQKKVQDNLS